MTRIIELRHGGAFVRVAPALGARVTRCCLPDAQGRPVELFHPYPEGHVDLLHWAKGGMYPLTPYWGRIGQAQLQYAGERFALQPHPQALPHTLHGTAHQAAWMVMNTDDARLTLRLNKSPDAHWPWRYEAEMTITLGRASLRVAISVRNDDALSMPAGIGLHPYLGCQHSPRLQFAARRCWVMTPDFLAIRAAPVDVAESFRAARSPGLAEFTRCYSDWDGRFMLTGGTERSPSLRIVASSTLDHLVVHRPAGAPYLCVEPVSHTADAFNLAAAGLADTGTRVLAPGQSLRGVVEFALE